MQKILHHFLQFGGGPGALKPDDDLFICLEIGQHHGDLFQAVLQGVNGGVDKALGPVFGGVVFGDIRHRQGGGFDLLDHHDAVPCEDTVRPSFQSIGDAVAGVFLAQGDLRLVIFVLFGGSALQAAVNAGAFVGPVKTGKTAVDAAGAQKKLNKPPHRQCDGQRRLIVGKRLGHQKVTAPL